MGISFFSAQAQTDADREAVRQAALDYKVNLQVRATNSAVIAFYQSLGYELEERASLGKRLGAA